MDHGTGSVPVEYNDAAGLVHEPLWVVHHVPGAGRYRRGVVQYDRADDHLGSVRG